MRESTDFDEIASAAENWRPAPEVFLFIKGRVALYAILRAMGIGAGDEVMVPGYTCVVVPAAISYTGARPVYYDIDPETYSGDVRDAIGKITRATRAVIIQHTFGMPGEDEELIRLCRQHGVYVIEDCAHGMGGSVKGRALGTLGDAGFASFQWTKPVSVGLGGVARVNDASLLSVMETVVARELRAPSVAKALSLWLLAWGYGRFMSPRLYWSARSTYHALGHLGVVSPSSSKDELDHPEVMPPGYTEGFGRLRTRQLESALGSLPASIAHRAEMAAIYEGWCTERGVPIQRVTRDAVPVHLRFPIRVRDRDVLLEAAQQAHVELGDWFNAPLHPDIHESPGLGYEKGMCPQAELAAEQVVNLPTHPGISTDEAKRILAFMEEYEALLIR